MSASLRFITRTTLGAALLLLAVTSLTGCDDSDPLEQCACTEVFKTISLDLSLPDGSPAEGATVRVELAGSGTVLIDEANEFERGRYTVATDGMLDQVSVAGTPIRITATLGDLAFETTWLVGKDSCGCHIELREGDRAGTMASGG